MAQPGRRPQLPALRVLRPVDDHRPQQPLDTGIVRALWMSHEQLLAQSARLRSPLVLRCLQDYLLGKRQAARFGRLPRPRNRPAGGRRRQPVAVARGVQSAPCPRASKESSSACPAASIPPSPRLLLKRAGFDVHGLYMSNWEDDDSYCTGAQDFQDARAVAAELGIPLHRVSFAERVSRARVRVLPHRISRRPHAQPRRALQSRNQVRHLPRLCRAARRRALRHRPLRAPRARPAKDRCCSRRATRTRTSPTSCTPSRASISPASCFPLGELTKTEVRALAREAGLAGVRQARQHRHLFHRRAAVPRIPRAIHPDHARRHRHRTRRARWTPPRAGVLHAGPTRRPRDRRPRRAARGCLVRRRERISRATSSSPCRGTITPCSSVVRWPPAPATGWCSPARLEFESQIKVRYRQADQACQARLDASGALEVRFAQPQRAVTPGQFAVLYDGDRCLGGGVIERTTPQ